MSGVRCQVSGVRCQVSGVKFQVSGIRITLCVWLLIPPAGERRGEGTPGEGGRQRAATVG